MKSEIMGLNLKMQEHLPSASDRLLEIAKLAKLAMVLILLGIEAGSAYGACELTRGTKHHIFTGRRLEKNKFFYPVHDIISLRALSNVARPAMVRMMLVTMTAAGSVGGV
jgi:hypothetical protein